MRHEAPAADPCQGPLAAGSLNRMRKVRCSKYLFSSSYHQGSAACSWSRAATLPSSRVRDRAKRPVRPSAGSNIIFRPRRQDKTNHLTHLQLHLRISYLLCRASRHLHRSVFKGQGTASCERWVVPLLPVPYSTLHRPSMCQSPPGCPPQDISPPDGPRQNGSSQDLSLLSAGHVVGWPRQQPRGVGI